MLHSVRDQLLESSGTLGAFSTSLFLVQFRSKSSEAWVTLTNCLIVAWILLLEPHPPNGSKTMGSGGDNQREYISCLSQKKSPAPSLCITTGKEKAKGRGCPGFPSYLTFYLPKRCYSWEQAPILLQLHFPLHIPHIPYNTMGIWWALPPFRSLK